MKSMVHFVVVVLLSLGGGQSSYSQELAAITPGMALETQLRDVRLEPKPLLVAQTAAKPDAEPKKRKEKKASKKKGKAKKSDSKEADGDSAKSGSSSSATAASGDKIQTNTNKSEAGKDDPDGDDTTKSVTTQAPAKPAAKPAGKAGSKPGQQFSGNASWYGVPFHGRKTASGEIFDMYKCSAAHKSLPMVSRVLVEDPRTGNTVLVRVNDRGPFVKTRVMDLSREAARKLGTMSRGVYYIEATVLGK